MALYDAVLPEVYGYLASRCGSSCDCRGSDVGDLPRRRGRREPRRGARPHTGLAHRRRPPQAGRPLASPGARAAGAALVVDDPVAEALVDDWDVRLDALVAQDALAGLGADHRSALTLRYLDGLPVRDVADVLGRTVGATEVLLVRAKAAFRDTYDAELARRATEA